jgi:hypothetical protein
MTSDASTGARGRSLQDDLLEDLRQGPGRPPTTVPAAPEPARPAAVSSSEPTVELRITPRSWSPAGVRAMPDGRGFVLSVGPVRLSLGRTTPSRASRG